MKTTFLCAVAVLAAALLVSATVWEGVTDVGSPRDMPGAYSIATNSFPRNTVIDVTNLENGKTVRVIVTSSLETTGLLSTLSPSAAGAIDLRHDSTCRIRMTQPSDNASHYTLGSQRPLYQLGPIDASGAIASTPESESVTAEGAPVANNVPAMENTATTNSLTTTESVTPVSRPAATENASVATSAPVTESAPAASISAVTENTTPANKPTVTENAPAVNNTPSAGKPAATVNIIAADEPAATDNEIAVSEPPATNDVIMVSEPTVTNDVIAAGSPAGTVTENQPEPRMASGTLTLIPANERIPTAQEQPMAVSRTVIPRNAAPRNVPLPVTKTVVTPAAAYAPPADFSPFQAPLISSLERGKWYVQLGVYSRPDNVEDEIIRIGSAYPVAVQNIGTDTSPMFRVLLGPLNQGECGAILQRFKSIGYPDAFVRHN